MTPPKASKQAGMLQPRPVTPTRWGPALRQCWPWLLVAGAAIATYLTALSNDFVSDAVNLIKNNHSLVNSREWLAWFSRNYTWGSIARDPTLYRPLTVISNVITARIWGAHPLPFLIGNVLIHTGVSLLVLAMGRRLMGPAAALIGALIFAVHPLHTEAVAWISGRPDLLATLFSAASAFSFLRATEMGAPRPALFAAGAVVSYLAALFSKEHAVVLPAWFALAWLIERRRRSLKWTGVVIVGSAIVLLIFLMLRARVVTPATSEWEFRQGQHLGPPWAIWRWLTVLALAGHYARLFLWPGPLTFDHWVYGMVWVQSKRGLGVAELWGAAVALGLLAGFIWGVRKAPGLAQALAFAAVTYSIVSSAPPSPFLFMAERVTYLPTVGVCLGAGWLLAEMGRRAMGLSESAQEAVRQASPSPPAPPWSNALEVLRTTGWRGWVTVGIGVSLLAALSIRSAVRNFDWRSQESIARAALAVDPDSPQALAGLGNLAFNRQDYAEAETLLQRSRRINPTDFPAYVLLFGIYTRTGQPEKAIELFSEGVRAMPYRPEAYHHLGGLLWQAGRLAEAEARFREAIARSPSYFVSHLALGGLLLDQGRPAEAMEAFQAVTRLVPDQPLGWAGLARAAQALGRMEEAQSYAAKANAAALHRRRAHTGQGFDPYATSDFPK